MLKKDLLELIKDIADDNAVDEILKGTDFAKSMLSLDKFKEMVATNKILNFSWTVGRTSIIQRIWKSGSLITYKN